MRPLRNRSRGARSITIALVAMALTAMTSGTVHAQGDAELKQLREDLQRQQQAIEKERRALEEQRRKLDEAIERLEMLEAERNPPPPPPPPAPPPGGVTTAPPAKLPHLEIYGFAQLDAIQDFKRVDNDWNATLRPSKIPVVCPGSPGCGNNGETVISPKQSRFGVKGLAPTRLGDIKTQFEFDMFATGDDAGEANFRLRHAWGSLGPVLAGQTNSLFMDGDVFPNTIDYWGPAGMVFFRNPQVRWTPIDNRDGLTLAVAIENPGSAIDAGKVEEEDPNLDIDDHNEYPDGTFQARYTRDWGHVQGSALLRGVGFEVTTNPGADPSGTKFGWGLSGSTAINTFGKDSVMLQLTYGEAIAAYFNDGGNDLGPDSLGNAPNVDAKTIPSLGWMAYYNRYWNDEWSSAIGYSEHRQDNTAGQDGDSFKNGLYFSVNTLYTPVPNFMTGLEFLWGQREDNDDSDESDTRLQLSFKYSFDATIYAPDTDK